MDRIGSGRFVELITLALLVFGVICVDQASAGPPPPPPPPTTPIGGDIAQVVSAGAVVAYGAWSMRKKK